MITSLQYGHDQALSLEVTPDSLVADPVTPQGSPLDDPIQGIQEALAHPIGFPPLGKTVLPSDRVALALEPGLPCSPELVAGVVQALGKVGTPPELITIIRAKADQAIANKQLLAHLDADVADRLTVSEHDPNDREKLSFLGATKADQPCFVNRALCDADVVLPIGTQQTHDRLVGGLGVHHGWFPTFADEETQARFHKSLSSMKDHKLAKRKDECVEAAWMLGIQMVVLMVPAGNNRAMHILAGSPNDVWKQGNALAEGTWKTNVPRRASLVVAAIGGGPEQQTWHNITRTIDTALEAVEVNGTIAICSQLKTKPGPAMRRLATAPDYESADRAIRQKPCADSLPASRLNRALQRARVYLLSELEENDVQDLGVAYVADSSEINQLTSRHDSCLVMENGQHVSISLNESA